MEASPRRASRVRDTYPWKNVGNDRRGRVYRPRLRAPDPTRYRGTTTPRVRAARRAGTASTCRRSEGKLRNDRRSSAGRSEERRVGKEWRVRQERGG